MSVKLKTLQLQVQNAQLSCTPSTEVLNAAVVKFKELLDKYLRTWKAYELLKLCYWLQRTANEAEANELRSTCKKLLRRMRAFSKRPVGSLGSIDETGTLNNGSLLELEATVHTAVGKLQYAYNSLKFKYWALKSNATTEPSPNGVIPAAIAAMTAPAPASASAANAELSSTKTVATVASAQLHSCYSRE